MKYKLISGIILFIIMVIFVFQNTESVGIQLFFWNVGISRILLMSIVFLFGTAFGWILNAYVRHLKARE